MRKSRVSEKQLKSLKEPKHKLTTYALPFLRKGQEEPEWRRFTYKGLRAFLAEYKPDDPEGAARWQSYAVREEWSFSNVEEKRETKREAELYFSGKRIDKPRGKIRKRIKPRHAKKKRARKKANAK